LDVDVSADPTEETLPAIISPLDQRQYKLPIKSIGLKSDEYNFVMKGKIRPAVILTEGTTGWPTLSTEPLSLCVPLYTVDKVQIPQEFVVEVQAFKFPSKFYIPPSSSYALEESIARFELIQPIHQFSMKREFRASRPMMLTKEFYGLLKLQLTQYLGGVIDDGDKNFLNEYGTIILEEAKKQGVTV
jgi:hypothetical protein